MSEIAILPFKLLANYPFHLKSLLAFEQEGTPEYVHLQEAYDLINNLLGEINEKKRQSEETQSFLEVLQKIKKLPIEFISAQNKLLRVCPVSEERTKDVLENNEKIIKHFPVVLLLFKNELVAVKLVKSSKTNGSSLGRHIPTALDLLTNNSVFYMYHYSYDDTIVCTDTSQANDLFHVHGNDAVTDSPDLDLSKSYELPDTHSFDRTASLLDKESQRVSIAVPRIAFHSHATVSSISSADSDLELLMRPEASKLTLAMSSTKLLMVKNFSRLTLATKKQSNQLSKFFTSKCCLQKPRPQDDFVQSGTLTNASLSSVNPSSVFDSMISFESHDDKIHMTYLFKDQEDYTCLVDLLKTKKLFG